jgi:hypothetical protein
MKPAKGQKQEQKAPEGRSQERTPKLQVIKLEERIAPKLAANHNETVVRDPVKAPQPSKGSSKPRFRVVKLEERIALALVHNHNETLVR